MKCPICQQEMEVERKEISNNPENGKKYQRILYLCKTDDAWISVETPLTSTLA